MNSQLYINRNDALMKIKALSGCDLRKLATKYNVTVFKNGKKNKGWAGHVIESYLGLPLNSSTDPDFGDWELKVVPLKYLKNGFLTVKETMAVTMINENDIINQEFEESHLRKKLERLLIVTRIWENIEETTSILHDVHLFNLDDKFIYEQVKADYDLVRKTIIEEGFNALTGKMGKIVQPRTKGAGHGSTSRAFYVRAPYLKKILL
jgi:DNA mismatch repair protein MutH